MRKLGQGSSKDLYLIDGREDRVAFDFSDRISVFDYGALPDEIPGKGRALETSARIFFKLLEAKGLKSAVDWDLSTGSGPGSGKLTMMRASHAKFPGAPDTGLEFIPLEVIFRWGVANGSSLLKRRKDLKPLQRFEKPWIEFSTKLEATDRILDREEAARLAGGVDTLDRLEAFARRTCEALHDELKSIGLELWDGKIECALDRKSGEVLLVDALTLDELRVSVPGLEAIPFSKELLRQWLGTTHWAFEVAHAKRTGGDRWRDRVGRPPRLGTWRQVRLASLYEAFTACLKTRKNTPLLEWARKDPFPPKVFVMGSGGREAALRWRLKAEGCEVVAQAEGSDLVWISTDGDLEKGLVDEYERQGAWTYGPRREGARLEWSKKFGREIAAAAGVPSPRFEIDPAKLRSFAQPPVVKYDGLAAGKGVVVPHTWEEAEAALREWSAKGPVVLEEQLKGFEASIFFAVDSTVPEARVQYLGSAKDFKRRLPHNEGPNTGGMGAHCPHAEVTADDIAHFTEWARATLRELNARGIPYRGILYMGFLKDIAQGWKLLEYNARFGDPETQALVLQWPSEARVLRSLLNLDLRSAVPALDSPTSVVCLALVRKEYPLPAPPLDLPLWAGPTADDAVLFDTGSRGGRVAYVVAKGDEAPPAGILKAGDRIFEIMVESPWKTLLEWRSDIL